MKRNHVIGVERYLQLSCMGDKNSIVVSFYYDNLTFIYIHCKYQTFHILCYLKYSNFQCYLVYHNDCTFLVNENKRNCFWLKIIFLIVYSYFVVHTQKYVYQRDQILVEEVKLKSSRFRRHDTDCFSLIVFQIINAGTVNHLYL